MENPIKMDDMVYILDDLIYNDMVVSIWVNLITTSLRPKPGIMVNKGNHPKLAAKFRLVKYCNLPRTI